MSGLFVNEPVAQQLFIEPVLRPLVGDDVVQFGQGKEIIKEPLVEFRTVAEEDIADANR